MKRQVDIREISDGRLYGPNDLVKADTRGCVGCEGCCHGMGNTIILDPLDGYRLCKELEQDFAMILEKHLELNVVDGVILPNLKMAGVGEFCTFLNKETNRCTIHPARPGICRLFPLGRYYQGRDFTYFLQIHECPRAGETKVKVKKWVDTPEFGRYENFIRTWHFFLEDTAVLFENEPDGELAKKMNLGILQTFFFTPWNTNGDFYAQFEERLIFFEKNFLPQGCSMEK